MQRIRIDIFVILIAVIIKDITASAGPPFRTDDPVPVPYHHGEFYLFGTGVADKEGINGIGPAVEFNYGPLTNTQLHIIIPVAFSAPHNGISHVGLGDVELGIKYRFVEQSNAIPVIGTFPIMEVPTGNAGKNLGNGKTQVYIPLWLQKDIGKWTIYGGGGYWINPGMENKNWEFAGLLVQYNFADNFFLGMEIFHQTPSSVYSSDNTGLHLGGGIPVTKNYLILFSGDAGNGITGYKHFSCYLGFYHMF